MIASQNALFSLFLTLSFTLSCSSQTHSWNCFQHSGDGSFSECIKVTVSSNGGKNNESIVLPLASNTRPVGSRTFRDSAAFSSNWPLRWNRLQQRFGMSGSRPTNRHPGFMFRKRELKLLVCFSKRSCSFMEIAVGGLAALCPSHYPHVV